MVSCFENEKQGKIAKSFKNVHLGKKMYVNYRAIKMTIFGWERVSWQGNNQW